MKATGVTALFALLVAGLAGCLQDGGSAPDYNVIRAAVDEAAAQVLHVDHVEIDGHRSWKGHAGSHNMQLVGYSNGFDDSGDPDRIPRAGTYNELAVTPEHVYLVRKSNDGSYGGFSIIDIRDPARPHVVSSFAALGGADIEVNPEGTLAFFAAQRNSVGEVAGGAQSDSAGPPRGIYVVDISDKKAPVLDSFTAMPANGPHTLTFHRHANGSDYLLACTYDLVTDPATGAIVGSVPVTQRLIVFLIAPNPISEAGLPGPSVALVPVAQFQVTEAPPEGKLYFPHDAAVAIHPDTGQTLITLAYWDKGVRFLDFSTPPAPQSPGAPAPQLREIGAFTEFSPSAFNNIHFARAFDAPMEAFGADGERERLHVTVAEPEIVQAPDETGQITFLDTSDPTKPRTLGHWTLPRQSPPLGVSSLDFSPHNFDLWDGKVALAHNHAGVWIIDVSTAENMADPVGTGFYMTAKARTDSPTLQPRAWGVFEQGGLLYASDEATGLYVLRYTGP